MSHKIETVKKDSAEDIDGVVSMISKILVSRIEINEMHGLHPSRRIERLYHLLKNIVNSEKIVISDSRIANLVREIYEDTFEYGPISYLMRNNRVTEIMINNWDEIYIEMDGELKRIETTFKNVQHIRNLIEKIISPLGLRLDESSPMVDARLKDGSRINAVISPICINDIVVTIRKFKNDLLTAEDLIKNGTISEKIAAFIKSCVENKLNIIISGATSTGKTTFLNIVSNFIPAEERIVIIEETMEINLALENVVRLETRQPNLEGRGEITLRDLVRNSLRMRPDRIIVGEIRGPEAVDVLQAMNTGHEGSMTTLHANSPADLISRLETMLLMSSMNLTPDSVRRMMIASIDLIVHLGRRSSGQRMLLGISELASVKTSSKNFTGQNNYFYPEVKDIFILDNKGNKNGFVFTGYLPGFAGKIGWSTSDFNN